MPFPVVVRFEEQLTERLAEILKLKNLALHRTTYAEPKFFPPARLTDGLRASRAGSCHLLPLEREPSLGEFSHHRNSLR